jgi:hypothetical protein
MAVHSGAIPDYNPKTISLTWFINATEKYLELDKGVKNLFYKFPIALLKVIEYRSGISPVAQVALETLSRVKDFSAATDLLSHSLKASVSAMHFFRNGTFAHFTHTSFALLNLANPFKDLVAALTSMEKTRDLIVKVDAGVVALLSKPESEDKLLTGAVAAKVRAARAALALITPQRKELMDAAGSAQLFFGSGRMLKQNITSAQHHFTKSYDSRLRALQKQYAWVHGINKSLAAVKDLSFVLLGLVCAKQVYATRTKGADVPKIAFTALSGVATVFSIITHYHADLNNIK